MSWTAGGSDATAAAAGLDAALDRRHLTLKGRQGRVDVVVVRATGR